MSEQELNAIIAKYLELLRTRGYGLAWEALNADIDSAADPAVTDQLLDAFNTAQQDSVAAMRARVAAETEAAFANGVDEIVIEEPRSTPRTGPRHLKLVASNASRRRRPRGAYGLRKTVGDRYAANWVVDAFKSNGISYENSDRDRGQIYLDCLPLFTAGRVKLLDNRRLIHQFASLERIAGSLGKDKVDHGRGGHDDLCNSAAGALVRAVAKPRGVFVPPGFVEKFAAMTGSADRFNEIRGAASMYELIKQGRA